MDTAVWEQDDMEEQVEFNASKPKILLSWVLLHLTKWYNYAVKYKGN